MRLTRFIVVVVILANVGTLGCATASPAKPVAAAQPATPPDGLRWVQGSAEYVAAAIQAYRMATTRVEAEARVRPAGSWAVVLDADETILNNAAYQLGLYRDRTVHTPERWTAWVKERAATPIPGATRFLARVRELGGRIAIVTNRLASECDDTIAVFRTLNLAFDAMLCRPEGAPSDKNPRFRAVAAGETPASRTPIEIIAFVGDNIQDFPAASQSMRSQGEPAFTEFGVKWFVIPNPMYGSWQSAPAPAPAPAPRVVQPGAPGTESRVVTSTTPTQPKPTPADIAFMQGMIAHHAQAIEMVGLLKTRSTNDSMRMLGLRIEVSQQDEIQMMRAWLREHGAKDPGEHAHHDGPLMPGMLTPEEMSRLAGLKDAAFDRLFLELMIKHHEGALKMVKTLMESPGSAQLASVFAFAADVEADQTAEIRRMRALRNLIK